MIKALGLKDVFEELDFKSRIRNLPKQKDRNAKE